MTRTEMQRVFLAKTSESGRMIECQWLYAELDESGNRVNEKLLRLLYREKDGSPLDSVVEVDVEGVPHYGNGYNADSAAGLLWEVCLAALPNARQNLLEEA